MTKKKQKKKKNRARVECRWDDMPYSLTTVDQICKRHQALNTHPGIANSSLHLNSATCQFGERVEPAIKLKSLSYTDHPTPLYTTISQLATA